MSKKIFGWILVLAFSMAAFCRPVSASTDFKTTVETTYKVAKTGKTSVTKHFKVTNLTPTTYVTHYAIQLNNFKLENISGTNEGENIEPHVVKTEDATTISLTFPNLVVGEGKTRDFTISYQAQAFANLNGSVLEVNIPGQETKDGESNLVYIEIPKQFGQPYRTEPTPDAQDTIGDFTRLTYRNPGEKSILLVFGNQQSYMVHLRYELANESKKQQKTQIPLPPDTPYQQVFYQQLEPRPETITRDPDGNWLATYYLPANHTTIVTADIDTQVYLEPWNTQLNFAPTAQHVAKTEYWSLPDSQIASLTAKGNSTRDLYQTVIETLDYTDQNISEERKRLGATSALDQPEEAVCQEFTDLFVALARSQGVPARRAVGYAYSNQTELRPLSFDGDILHTWPEFFDNLTNSWRAVDPTWEDTTGGIDYFNHFDLSHLVFVYNGLSSAEPLPPGSYQQKFLRHKTISVNITDKLPKQDPELEISLEPISWLGVRLPVYKLKIINLTGHAWYNLESKLLSEEERSLSVNWLKTALANYILPFVQIEYPVVFTSDQSLPHLQTIKIQIKIATNFSYEKNQTVVVIPKLWLSAKNFWWLAGGITIVTLTGGSLLVFRQKRASSLRRQSQESQKSSQELLQNQNP